MYADRSDEADLVKTAMMLPLMDGTATIRAIEKMNPRVKIIASSGTAAPMGAGGAASSGVKAFISKPYTADKLLSTLHDILNGT